MTDGVIDFEIDRTPLQLGAGGAVFMKRKLAAPVRQQGDRPARALKLAVPAGIEGFFRDAASALPAGTSTEPPPPEALQAFAQIAGRYGVELQGDADPAKRLPPPIHDVECREH